MVAESTTLGGLASVRDQYPPESERSIQMSFVEIPGRDASAVIRGLVFQLNRAANPDVDLQFRYLTTAAVAVEQAWNRPEGAIETWMALRPVSQAVMPLSIAMSVNTSGLHGTKTL
jgi:hypothetical protein